jgi:non-canonical purine NTP pyrophosphatase (RdgB/HAM1 family)
MQKLFYATSNAGKFAEVEKFFAQHAPEFKVEQYKEDLVEIQTNDQQHIAFHKAQQAWEKLQVPVLVDDAGVYFEKYKDFPGTMSKFVYQGIGFEGLLKLAEPQDKAFFKVTVAYAHGNGLIELFDDTCFGFIVHPKNFNMPPTLPYLAIFAPQGETKSLAELRITDAMQRYNPRVNALKKFLQWHSRHS